MAILSSRAGRVIPALIPMKLTITINLDNAAFGDDDTGRAYETARILSTLADDLIRRTFEALPLNLRDVNGNKVGKAVVK